MTAPGVYGKLPGLGDFVTRRLPRPFVDAMDTWLQSVVAQSRERLGVFWLERYLSAPVWRFVLGPGVVDERLWVGVLVPSVDRVGRYFPFVVAVPAPWQVDPVSALVALEHWHDALEGHCLHALQTRAGIDALDAGLQGLALPHGVAVPPATGDEDDTLPLPRSSRLAAVVSAGAGASLAEVAARARPLAASLAQRACVWSAIGADGGALVLVTEGLPDGQRYCAMLDGDWQRSGWTDATQG